jgi:probable rRNA maturation factor
LDIHARAGRAHVAYVRRNLLAAHAMFRPALHEMSLALVGERRMAELHERFMGIAGSTDVLTFELEHDARGRVVAGEVVVCVPFALREAKRQKIQPKKELLLYALHGMLHLCGYDDRTDRDFNQMHHREDQILNALGVGAVFGGEKPEARNQKRDGRGPATGKAKALPAPPGIRSPKRKWGGR